MKRVFIHLFTILIYCNLSLAQFISEDASGESSIVYPGGGIKINITDGEIAANLFHQFKNKQSFIGVDVNGQNNDNIARIFDSGYVSSGNANLVGGITLNSLSNDLKGTYEDLKDPLDIVNKKYRTEYFKEIKKKFDLIKNIGSETNDYILNKIIEEIIDNNVPRGDTVKIINLIEEFKSTKTTDKNAIKVKEKIKEFETVFKSKYSNLNKERDSLTIAKKLARIELETSTNSSVFYRPYFSFGFEGLEFDQYNPSETVFENRFPSIKNVGITGKLGLNIEYKSFLVGFNYAYKQTSNFGIFSPQEFTIVATQNQISDIGTTELRTTQSKVAYSGTFKEVDVNSFNIDAIKFIDLNNNNDYINIHAYYRSNNSTDTEILPDTSNFGMGLYFFKKNTGKFLGGFYAEIPDINNNTSQFLNLLNLDGVIDKIRLGIVAKYNFNSIVDFNRIKE